MNARPDHRWPIGILGAGPGGAATALRLSYLGIPSVLIDKARFPREKVCGDAISGKVTTLLHRLDPAILERFQKLDAQTGVWGIRFVAPDRSPVDIPFPSGRELLPGTPPGFVCPRLDFDHFLIREVERRPDIQWMPGTEVRSIRPLRGGWTLENARNGSRIRASVLVDASGAYSRFARQQGGLKDDPAHYALAVRGYVEGVRDFPPNGFIELHFRRDLLPGYFWIFPLPGNRANVGLGILKNKTARLGMPLRKKLQEILDEHPRFRDARLLGPIRGYGLPLGSRVRPISGERFVLVGDAGKLIDPLTGEGIGNAFYSGFIAGELLARCWEENNFTARRLQDYDKRVARVLGSEMALSHRLQQAGQYPVLLNTIARIIRANHHLIDHFSRMYTDLELRRRLTRPGFWLRSAFGAKKIT